MAAESGIPSVAAGTSLPNSDSVSTYQTSSSCNCHNLIKQTMSITVEEEFALKNVEVETLKQVLAEQHERTVFLQHENSKQQIELEKLSSKLNIKYEYKIYQQQKTTTRRAHYCKHQLPIEHIEFSPT